MWRKQRKEDLKKIRVKVLKDFDKKREQYFGLYMQQQ
jgi:hypothetical protein